MSDQPVHGPANVDGIGTVDWRISTRSGNGGGNCVEAGPLQDGTGRIAVRHSQHPDTTAIIYTRAEWAAFLAGAKDGEFDFD